MKSNKVPSIDQTAKLREQLSGHPLALVPESIKDIQKAFAALRSQYGDEEWVLGLRVSERKKLGLMPEKFKDQVAFFINLEDILDLGAKGEHLGRLAYGQDVFNAVYNLVTVSQHIKLLAVPGDKYSIEKLQKTKDKLMEFRDTANMLDKTRVDSDPGTPAT